MEEKLKFAVFIDFDNIEIGVKTTLGREFEVSLVLEAIKERGEVVTKIAYGNWKMSGRHSEKMAAHAVQMVQRDPSPRGDKNGADINLALDALEMAFTRDFINAFAIVGGDSDFIALVEKLKQYNKAVYVLGGRGFTSTILQKNCREFISYENLISDGGAPAQAPASGPSGAARRPRRASVGHREDVLPLSNVLPLLARAMKVLADREHQPLLGLVKSTLTQLDSTFTERDYGVNSFLDFAQKLAHAGLVRLDRDNSNYMLTLTGGDQPAVAPQRENREDTALEVLRSVLQEAAQRGRKEFHAHGLKQFLSKMRPGFDERKYGFKQFSALVNLAHDRGLVSIAPDERGAMRVRTVLAPAAETVLDDASPSAPLDLALHLAGDAEQKPEDTQQPIFHSGFDSGFDSGQEPLAEAADVQPEALPEEPPAAPRRRRRSGPARPRTPRKKKTP